jgi:hypothetical protein
LGKLSSVLAIEEKEVSRVERGGRDISVERWHIMLKQSQKLRLR